MTPRDTGGEREMEKERERERTRKHHQLRTFGALHVANQCQVPLNDDAL